jgi:hypothetical protein
MLSKVLRTIILSIYLTIGWLGSTSRAGQVVTRDAHEWARKTARDYQGISVAMMFTGTF